MKISKIEAVSLKIPKDSQKGMAGTPGTFMEPQGGVKSDYGWTREYSSIYSTKVESLVVKITTDTGLVGWGEAQVPIAPEAPQAIVERVLYPLLAGRDPLEIEVLWNMMYNCLRTRGHRDSFMMDAIAAVDIALWDLAGKYYSQPVYRLLGGKFHNPLPLYHSGLNGSTLEEMKQSARKAVEEGYQAIKLYIGRGVERDVKTVRAIRDEIGYGVKLMADALWMYNVHDAIRLGKELEKLDVLFLEAPTVLEDVAGNAEISRALTMAVAQGETERTRYQYLPFFKERALDIIQPDIGRTGITEGKKILTLAETFNIPATLHMSIGQCIYIAASAHMAAATPNLLWLEANPAMFNESVIQKNPWKIKNGALEIPDLPGLGMELNETELQRLMNSREIGV